MYGEPMKFDGEALKEAREAKGMSLELLAGMADCSVQTVINAETGSNDPIGSTVAKMARALGVTMDSLYIEGEAA